MSNFENSFGFTEMEADELYFINGGDVKTDIAVHVIEYCAEKIIDILCEEVPKLINKPKEEQKPNTSKPISSPSQPIYSGGDSASHLPTLRY